MPITPDVRSPSLVRGISLTEDTNQMLMSLAGYYKTNASAVVRALIEQEYLLLAAKTDTDTVN